MKKRNILKWIIFGLALAVNLFIIANSFIGGDVSTAESNIITNASASVVNSISPGTISNNNYAEFVVLVRKIIGHFALFGLSGILSTWACYLFFTGKKINYFLYLALISLGVGIFIAGLSEFIQLFMAGRNGSIGDVGIDTLGYFIGDLAVILFIFLMKKPIFHKSNFMKKQAE